MQYNSFGANNIVCLFFPKKVNLKTKNFSGNRSKFCFIHVYCRMQFVTPLFGFDIELRHCPWPQTGPERIR